MEPITTLSEVRDCIISGSIDKQTKFLTSRLVEERTKIIKYTEDFMGVDGIEQPITAVLELFSDYLRMCGYLERLAEKFEHREEVREDAKTIREEYLPRYSWLNDNFYIIKELLGFVAKVGESKLEADVFEQSTRALSRN